MRLESEDQKPASVTSAGLLQRKMKDFYKDVGFPDGLQKNLEGTWVHEMDHFNSDKEKNTYGGEFGYHAVAEIDLTSGLIMASFVAYYQPSGPDFYEDPERWMNIATAPDAPSAQDQKVYDMAYQQWLIKMKDEALKTKEMQIEQDLKRQEEKKTKEELKPRIIQLIAIPRIDGERIDDYEKRSELVKALGKEIDRMIEDGTIPKAEEIAEMGITNFLREYRNDIDISISESLRGMKAKESAKDVNEPNADEKENKESDKKSGIIFDSAKY